MIFHVISQATAKPDYKLHLIYSDGERVTVDFKPIIERGGIFQPLATPQFFSQVSIGERGRYIEWPGGIDFCADALRLEGQLDLPAESSTLRAGTHD